MPLKLLSHRVGLIFNTPTGGGDGGSRLAAVISFTGKLFGTEGEENDSASARQP